MMILLFYTLTLFGIPEDNLDDASIQGRWHQVEVCLHIDASAGVGPKARDALERSTKTQASVKKQIERKELGIITQFNRDGTYTHEVVDAAPEKPFPRYREAGRWKLNAAKRTLSRSNDDSEVATAELAKVVAATGDQLILEIRFQDSQLKGLVETIRLRRFRELKAQ